MSPCRATTPRTPLAFQSHERVIGTDPAKFNFAHDYIINNVPVEALGRPIPAGGLEWSGSRHMSTEQMMRQLYSGMFPFIR